MKHSELLAMPLLDILLLVNDILTKIAGNAPKKLITFQ